MEQQPSSSQTHSGLEPTRADFDAVVAERDALKDEVATLSSQLATVLARVSELEALRKTNSNNSSKPPSSDPPFQGPFRSNKPTGKKPGRQDGHEGVTNTPFAADAVTPEPLVPASCGHCGNDFAPDSPETSPPLVFQHIELPATPPPVIEYRRHERCCASCGRVTRASLPGDVGPSPYGARLQAMIVTWTFQFHLSRLKIQSLLASQYGLTISIGTIQKIIERVAAACETGPRSGREPGGAPVEDLKAAINNAPVVNADETGHKHQGPPCGTPAAEPGLGCGPDSFKRQRQAALAVGGGDALGRHLRGGGRPRPRWVGAGVGCGLQRHGWLRPVEAL